MKDPATKGFYIGNKWVSESRPPLIVAELSANQGDIDRAKHIISLAKKSGADAAKIQSYEPGTITLECDKDDFLIKQGLWKGKACIAFMLKHILHLDGTTNYFGTQEK